MKGQLRGGAQLEMQLRSVLDSGVLVKRTQSNRRKVRTVRMKTWD